MNVTSSFNRFSISSMYPLAFLRNTKRLAKWAEKNNKKTAMIFLSLPLKIERSL